MSPILKKEKKTGKKHSGGGSGGENRVFRILLRICYTLLHFHFLCNIRFRCRLSLTFDFTGDDLLHLLHEIL